MRLGIVGAVLVASASFGCMAALPYLGLPDVSGLEAYKSPQHTVLFDAKGRRIAAIGAEIRQTVPLSAMSPMLPQAVIAMEDARFYHHFGVDPIGFARAVIFMGKRGGGSTLTQQLAKNLYLSPEQTLKRKLVEAVLAVQIEQAYTKEQILELYLNQVYWGHGAFGCDAAAMTYFGKPASKLNLAESAQLAGILQGPELYTPYRQPEVAKQRQKLVLDLMLAQNLISQAEYDEALAYELRLVGLRSVNQAPYFTAYVRELLIKQFGPGAIAAGGLKVTTSLDLDWQKKAEQVVAQQVAAMSRHRVGQAALISLDPHTGQIKAMVGGTDFNKSEFNRVVQAHRQPGSSFKPFVYLTALANGMTPETLVVDEPVSYPMAAGQRWTPHNYDRKHHGEMSLRRSLELSNNVIAAKLIHDYGPDQVIHTARQLGITSPMQANLSLSMGSSEVTPLELASAFGTLATGGKWTPTTAILKVEDAKGKVLVDWQPRLQEVYPAEPVAMLVDMMQGVITRGTGRAAAIGRPAAGKTGTSSDSRDAWFAGFTPELVTVVWAGNDDFSPMRGLTGGGICAPIWAKFMAHATRGLPSQPFPVPAPLQVLDGSPSDEAALVEIKPDDPFEPWAADPEAPIEPRGDGRPTEPVQPLPGELVPIDPEPTLEPLPF